MQRDKKLGLALGILLIGTIGALFFRNEPAASGVFPELQSAESIDAAIRQRSRLVPYLTEGGVEARSTLEQAAVELSESKVPSPVAQTAAETGATPEPIRFSSKAAAIPAPDVSPQQASFPQTDESDAVSPDGTPHRLYRLQSGDTLTGLAARFLGDADRFGEIYRLNRDRLGHPNDLRAGMNLRIPVSGKKTEIAARPKPAPSPPEVSAPQSLPPVTAPTERKSRFVPVPRSPQQFLGTVTPTQTSPDRRTETTPQRYYRVQRGDSLERIAVRVYGRRSAADKIFAANRDRLHRPNVLREGMTLVLP